MLQKLGFAPGFNKQVTETGAEGQWFDGDNVRFRYGTPEKIGGWQQLGESKLTGAAELFIIGTIMLVLNMQLLEQTEFYMFIQGVLITIFTL
jgi:hypothetical protein